MSKLYHINSAYPLVQSLYGIEADAESFEDLAMTAWELIGNRHTRLYRYVGDTKNRELELPCNLDIIESVHIPINDAQVTSNRISYNNLDSIFIEGYIDAWKFLEDPFNQRGKLVKYKEGGNTLYFNRDYKNVMVVYHGIIADEEDGLPMINDREMKAIAAFIAYTESYKDLLKKRDNVGKVSLSIVQSLKEEWFRRCNAARVPDHVSQNDMNMILDVKSRWDRKHYGLSMKPIL